MMGRAGVPELFGNGAGAASLDERPTGRRGGRGGPFGGAVGRRAGRAVPFRWQEKRSGAEHTRRPLRTDCAGDTVGPHIGGRGHPEVR